MMSNLTTEPTQPTACVVIVENQRIPLPTPTMSDDDLRKMIAPFWPSAANAEIKRETKDGVLEITLVKRPGTKGSGLLEVLRTSDADGVNPAVAMYYRLMNAVSTDQLDLARILPLRGDIQAAIAAGQAEAQAVRQALHTLQGAAASPHPKVPVGF
jgi:hypothetical protein